jgi:hypothetical protein
MKVGRKPSCLCGTCKTCVQRSVAQRCKLRKKGIDVPRKKREFREWNLKDRIVSEEELERRMVQHFVDKGWETEEWQRNKKETKCPTDKENETSKDRDMISSHLNFSMNLQESLKKVKDRVQVYLMDMGILGKRGERRFFETV